MQPQHSSPPRPGRRRRTVVIGLVAAVIVFFGVAVAINLFSSSGSSAVDRLEKVLDALPLPPGTKQTGQDSNPAASPVRVSRTYELASPDSAGPQLVATLKAADYRPVEGDDGTDDPTGWKRASSHPVEGFLFVLPPRYHGRGGIDLTWDHGLLTVRVNDFTFPRPGSSP